MNKNQKNLFLILPIIFVAGFIAVNPSAEKAVVGIIFAVLIYGGFYLFSKKKK